MAGQRRAAPHRPLGHRARFRPSALEPAPGDTRPSGRGVGRAAVGHRHRSPRLDAPVGPTVTGALGRLRVASWLRLVCAVLALLLTGQLILALLPAVAYFAFRGYTLRRYWIRGRIGDDQLELRGVSGGFKAHVDAVVAAPGRP